MFAVIQLADFPLQAVRRIQGAPGSGPAAVLAADARPAVIIACDAAARSAGVSCGQTPPQALAGCAQLRLWSRNPTAETEAQSALLAAAAMLAPAVEDTAPGVATIDLRALPADRREAALSGALAQLERLGLDATAALAETPWLARLAAPEAKPWRTVGDARTFLEPLPLARAEPSPEHAEILRHWGIATLGALAALPKAAVAQRLGADGVALWERAAGGSVRPLRVVRPKAEFAASWDSEHELETLEPVLFVLRRMSDRLALELTTAGLAAGAIGLTLRLARDGEHARHFRLPEATTDAEILFRTLATYLENVRTDEPVTGVALRFEPTRPRTRQQAFFEQTLRDPHGLAETLARAVAIVGSGRVGMPRNEDTHRPDVVQLEPPPLTLAEHRERPGPPLTGWPLRRYRPPRPATVELSTDNPGDAEEEAGSVPSFLLCGECRGAVAARCGPWLGVGEWWERERVWRREEWDVELADGGVYRLVHTPEGWFVDGEYD